jgi:hypothetical protein
MNHPETPRHVEVKDGDRIVAAAEVTMPMAGTARTSLHAAAGHIAPGWRANLVDAVMDLPEVQASARLEATVPLGDVEFLQRLRERTIDAITRPVGSTVLLDATIPHSVQPARTAMSG